MRKFLFLFSFWLDFVIKLTSLKSRDIFGAEHDFYKSLQGHLSSSHVFLSLIFYYLFLRSFDLFNFALYIATKPTSVCFTI